MDIVLRSISMTSAELVVIAAEHQKLLTAFFRTFLVTF
jgi:hypothetical protein